MNPDSDFEAYLHSKKIDSQAFRSVEPDVWNVWKSEFEQMHPNSFTVQKLNLINVIRRKYLLKTAPVETTPDEKIKGKRPAPAPKPGK